MPDDDIYSDPRARRHRVPPKEQEFQMAEEAIEALSDPVEKEWFRKLLDILRKGKRAIVFTTLGDEMDVIKLSHTTTYASFFDVINKHLYFDISKPPQESDDCRGTIGNFNMLAISHLTKTAQASPRL